MRTLLGAIAPYERHGASDFPSIFYQRPRKDKKMELHWDGNNPSLDERNLSAALGAGVTPKSVDHKAIERVADWLLDLRPPASPHRPDPGAVARGRARYMTACAACHGYQGEGGGYVFEGANLGKVEPIAKVATDRGRLDSYTEAFRQRQLAELFADTPYQFKYFVKTDGYANQPLAGLWLRAPYLHNGSVPTLRDLLAPPAARPAAFVRGIDLLDGRNGGFVSPSCTPGQRPPQGFCYDTRVSGNGNGGHDYGTTLSAAEKDDLIAYLLTF
jgi:mono/diheme cytochrome c family protein